MRALELREIFNGQLSPFQRDEVVLKVYDHREGVPIENDCRNCGACCVAFSIKGLKKQAEICPNLDFTNGRATCLVYNTEAKPKDCSTFDCRELNPNRRIGKDRVIELYAAKEVLKRKV